MIVVKELVKKYGDSPAVSGISFEVQDREVMGFLGPNGAGKSTTLRILSGFLAPSSGSAELAGCDVVEQSLEVRRRIGYLPENNPLYEEFTACEHLEWTAQLRGFSGRSRTVRVRAAVEACGLGEVLAKPIALLSKGYRQRLGLAAAILHDPEILLLDEPTSGLDPNQAQLVRDLIVRLKAEKTVLLSTHILSEVESSCDRVLILNHGKIAASGTPRELVRRAGCGQGLRLALKAKGLQASAVRKALEELSGVKSASLERIDGELVAVLNIEAAAGDLREPLFRLAVRKKWVLLELRRREAALESVFRELTLG